MNGIGYFALPRLCGDCGRETMIMVGFVDGVLLCRDCFLPPPVRQPATPTLDLHMARVDACELGLAGRRR
jgi:hypothetical protein